MGSDWVIESVPGQNKGSLMGGSSSDWEIISMPGKDQKNLPSFRQGPSEGNDLMSTVKGAISNTWDTLFSDKNVDRAKAANAVALSESTGLAPSVIYDNMDKITSEIGLRDQPGFREHSERLMMAPVVTGLMANPVATVLGIGAFAALSELENYAVSKFNKEKYQFGAGKGLSDVIPEDSSQTVKDIFWLTDMAAKAVGAGGLVAGGKWGVNKFAEKYMRDVTEAYNLPRNVYISPEKIREFHGLGREDVISPEESSLLKDINLSRQDYINALKDGIDIEIPTEKIITIQDKPWVKALKDSFRVSPYVNETIIPGGPAMGKRPVSGLIEGGQGRRGFEDILKDVSTIFESSGKEGLGNERGSIGGTREMMPEEAAARERLRNDITILKQKAAEAGKDLGAFLKEYGFDEAAVSSVVEYSNDIGLRYPRKEFNGGELPASSQAGSEGRVNGEGFSTGEQPGNQDLRPLSEILKDILSAFQTVKGPRGERGSYSNKDNLNPEAQAARDRLSKDFEVLRSEAKSVGKDLFNYMVDNGVNPESATYMIGMFGGSGNGKDVMPAEDVNDLLDMAARQDKAIGTGDIGENPAYEAIRQKAADLAFEKVQKKIDLSRRKAETQVKKQAIEDAKQDPVFVAMDEIIKAGGLKYDSIAADYDKDTVTELVRKRVGLVSKEGRFAPDEAADIYGFESSDDLINAILEWKGLKAEAEARKGEFLDRYGEVLTDLEKDDFHADVLREEAKILRQLMKENTPKPATGLKKIIREKTGQTRVDELFVSEYDALKASMKKSEQAARIAYREGRLDGVLKEKERQLDIAERLKAKHEAKQEAYDIRDGILGLTKNKSIPEDARIQIESLLSDYDLLPRSEATRQKIESTREYIERMEAQGEDVNIPKALLDKIDRYGRMHWRDMTLDQLRDIYDQANMIAHLGKLKSKLLVAKKGRDYEGTVNSIVGTIQRNWPGEYGTHDIETMLLDKSTSDKLKEAWKGYLAELIKPEMIFRKFDKWEDMGPTWSALYEPVKVASDAQILLDQQLVQKLEDAFAPFKKLGMKWAGEKFKIDTVPQILTKEKMIMVALNSGNQGNIDALMGGYQWTESQIQKITDKLSPEEWGFVRSIWDIFKWQFPKLGDTYKQLTGTNLVAVEGDYFPLVFDRALSWIADKNATESELKDFFQSIYTKPKPESGFTMMRTGGTLPPRLSFDVIFKHASDVNHYTTHAIPVRDVQKLISDPRVRAAIEESESGGPEIYKQLMPWLQEIAKPRTEPMSITENILKTLRRNTTTVALGLKVSTAISQWLGLTNSIEELGSMEVARGLAAFYKDRENMVDQVKLMSPEMAARSSNWDRELHDAYGRLGLEKFKGQQTIKDAYFGLISLMDMAVAYPTWLAAYNQKMEGPGVVDQPEAIQYADMVVRKTQGTAMPKDLAGIQRGSELKKFVTMFYTFFSAMHNQMSEIHNKFSAGEKNAVELFKAWWWVIVLPALTQYMINEREVPGAKTAAKEILKYRIGGYPVVRDFFSPLVTDFDYTFSPVTRAGTVLTKAGRQFEKIPSGEVEYDKLFQYGVESSGYLFGLPTGQAVITIKGFNDLKNGETSDLTRLLMRKPRPDEED